MSDQEVGEFLEHFGIKGMHWGIRRKLDKLKTDHASRKEKGARKYEAKATLAQTKISDLQSQMSSKRYSRRNRIIRNRIRKLNEVKMKALKNAEAKRKGGLTLTSTQKTVLAGAAGVATLLALKHVAKTGAEGEASAIRRFQSNLKFGSIFRIDKSLAGDLTPDQALDKVARTVNPMYNTRGGHMNCRRSTFTYELRRRGYAVDAMPSSIGRGQSETGLINALIPGDRNVIRPNSLSQMIAGGKGARARATSRDRRAYTAFTKTVKKISEARSTLSSMPTGSRGEIVFDEGAFGHSMAWEKFKDGTVRIFDSQKGEAYNVDAYGLENIFRKWGDANEMAITRLDDQELDLRFLSRWARNSRKGN